MSESSGSIQVSAERAPTYSIPRALFLLSGSTLLSRIFGLAREIAMSALFSPMVTDAFIVAFRIPNILRRLFGEGALSVSVVPVMTEYHYKEGSAETRSLVNALFSVALIVLGVLTLAGILGAPWIVKLLAPGEGFSAVPRKYELTTTLVRFTFPYIFFAGMVALCMGVLNTRKHFFAPAFSPVIFNLVQIAAMVGLGRVLGYSGIEMGIGVLAGGTLQLLLQMPYLKSNGVWPAWNPHFSHRGVRKIGRLMAPSLLGLSAAQLSSVIMLMYASFLPEGSISYLFWADRLMELPLGVLAVAAGTASLPVMSELAQEKNLKGLYHYTVKSLRLLSFCAIPATVGLVVLREPIVRVLFERGKFGPEDTVATAAALLYYAFGLWASASVRMIAPAFYALQNAKIPALSALLAVAIQLSYGWWMMKSLGHSGLALATSIGLWANFLLLFAILSRRCGVVDAANILKELVTALGQIVIASAAMGLLVHLLWNRGISATIPSGGWEEGVVLFSVIFIGALAYFAAAWLMRCEDIHDLKKKLVKNL
ncbi:MAG: murein biosynthesis integral membrane protein MurJ [Deltaproteobacteria bacterium]|nr:murein biosynthesis integral membrane protein MurJ [Deltaproteobacteria bacterium]